MGNKFILEGDEINPNKEPHEKGEETKDLITRIEHDPADRQADGRWKGTIVQMKVPVKEIKWEGLTDKNSDMQYAQRQLLSQSDYDTGHKEIFERRVSKYRKLLDGSKEGIKWIF